MRIRCINEQEAHQSYSEEERIHFLTGHDDKEREENVGDEISGLSPDSESNQCES